VSVPVSHFDEDKFISGHAFDGSSIAGWKGIEASDMLLMPDPATANIDPFFEEPTLPELRRARAGRRQGLRARSAFAGQARRGLS
jgi:glutamine synthetase